MDWITITRDDVLEEFTEPERATLANIVGNVDKLEGILRRVINKARGAVIAAGASLGDEGSVPPILETAVVDVARWRLLVAYPQLRALQTKDRKDAHDAGEKLFRDVAAREVLVQAAGADAPQSVLPSFGTTTRNFTDTTQDG